MLNKHYHYVKIPKIENYLRKKVFLFIYIKKKKKKNTQVDRTVYFLNLFCCFELFLTYFFFFFFFFFFVFNFKN
ncbi:hypothetical protein PFMALIP_05348 [Plasmodium falciparum MaliPS096_E11]|uniref:Uncharacterized protein n=1 Tax=Plasmodium falciparum MaliPS096_E11 TaxID=1036727 RepID=A0A024WH16_PLAFA|nr:hypothetical protein PFMALIP_05348 [Plasmodium falciparum MaliPS096_E11]